MQPYQFSTFDRSISKVSLTYSKAFPKMYYMLAAILVTILAKMEGVGTLPFTVNVTKSDWYSYG